MTTSTSFDEAKHPRTGNGRFKDAVHGKADPVNLPDPPDPAVGNTTELVADNLREVLASYGVTEVPFVEWPEVQVPIPYPVMAVSRRTRREIAEALPEPRRTIKMRELETFYGGREDEPDQVIVQIPRPYRTSFFGGMDFDHWLNWRATQMVADGYGDYTLKAVS